MAIDKDNRAQDVLISPRGVVEALRTALQMPKLGFEAASPESPEDLAWQQEVGMALEQALALFENEPERGSAMFAPDHPGTSLLQSFLAETASGNLEDLRAGGKLSPVPDGGYEAKFDNHDIAGWAASLLTWWKRVVKKHPFLPPVAGSVQRIPDHARIAILGDWGSGRYGAPVCAATIQAARPNYDVLLHLGDVYYSGTTKEVQERFLDIWPKVPGALSRALNSNHEMYSGGEGYFKKTLPAFGQASSCFALENSGFVLIGLDTGYDEHDLTEEQLPWLADLLQRAHGKTQKVVLFSHHQPFSALERQGGKLVQKLRAFLEQRRIFAWYWGHEHRAAIYEQHPQWGLHGRLIGHSGFPYFRGKLSQLPLDRNNEDGSQWRHLRSPDAPPAIVLDGPNPYVTGEEVRFGPNGYLSLELHGSTIRETVHAPNGTVLLRREIQ